MTVGVLFTMKDMMMATVVLRDEEVSYDKMMIWYHGMKIENAYLLLEPVASYGDLCRLQESTQ